MCASKWSRPPTTPAVTEPGDVKVDNKPIKINEKKKKKVPGMVITLVSSICFYPSTFPLQGMGCLYTQYGVSPYSVSRAISLVMIGYGYGVFTVTEDFSGN
ncbi:hypothetical protein CEXT_422811 [Caerostris extrusa]|uniref:Uncharacterized protein n=1 Tax=Caerostris extrusa TaxID=172846 RepID=A0AAV4V4U1_CAEEX|nr:hypothetical protein CEXT_422811 [Caerostris extrusa]